MFGIFSSSLSLIEDLKELDWLLAPDSVDKILHKLGKRGDLHLEYDAVVRTAMAKGQRQHFSILQSYGCRFDIIHPKNFTFAPLWVAVMHGNRQAIDFLMNQNVPVSYEMNGNKRTPLELLPQNYDYQELLELCERLISRGASLGNWEGSGSIPLLLNLAHGASIDTIKVLLDLGADPHITDGIHRNCLDELSISSFNKNWVTDPDHVELYVFEKAVSYEVFLSYITDVLELLHSKGINFHTKTRADELYDSFYAKVLAIKQRPWGSADRAHYYDAIIKKIIELQPL